MKKLRLYEKEMYIRALSSNKRDNYVMFIPEGKKKESKKKSYSSSYSSSSSSSRDSSDDTAEVDYIY